MTITMGHLRIRTKLIAIITFTAGISLLLACLAFMSFEMVTYRSTAAVGLTTMAQMIGDASEAALAFGDPRAAQETLNTLRHQPHILEACLYARDGAHLASYSRDSHPERIPAHPIEEGTRPGKSDLSLSYPVIFKNDRIGTVYLKSDLAEIDTRLWRYGGIAGAVLLVSIAFALAVSSILQHLISAPILHLAETASRVSREGNYSIRATKSAGDETGVLVDRFNDMLEQIHTRDGALQAARDDLERRVEERTRQLQIEIGERKEIEKHLISAKETAEASNKAKSEFLANMSHELRTPLNAIIGYSEMLEEDAPGMPGAGMIPDLRRIHGAGKHLLSLINDVLDLSKIEAGRVEIHPEVFKVESLLNEVAATVEPLARQGGNQLLLKCQDPDARMYADPLKFRQCLLNLLSNACKFTNEGTISVEVGRRFTDGREWFEWTVKDTGVGIPPEQMHKLFKSFSQVDSSSTRKHGGTGLGLAISRHLCRLMGGDILAESAPGAGSKFTILVPAAIPASADENRDLKKNMPAFCDPSKPQTVLVIEDDPAELDLLERTLSKRGFGVVSAANGVEGIRQAIEHNPSAIVLDIRMPDLDGWTVFRTLRADPRFTKTPILVHSITDTRPADIALDGAEFLQKPVAVEQLIAILKRHCVNGFDGAESSTPEVAKTVKAECPDLFELGAGSPLLVRITETTPELISFDFKITDETGRELFDTIANCRDWQRLSVLRMRSPVESGGLSNLLAAVERHGSLEMTPVLATEISAVVGVQGELSHASGAPRRG